MNHTIEHTTLEAWSRQMAVNVGGVFLCSKYFLPHLRKSRSAIVNMSSVNGFFVEPGCTGYCATKGAITARTKAMAIDHGREGIRVNCICPGYIDAGLAQGYFEAQPDPAAARAAAGGLHALGRIGTPEEVARVAVFLASDESSFMTGSVVVVMADLAADSRPTADHAAPPGRFRDWVMLRACNLMWASQFAMVELVQNQMGPWFAVTFPMAISTLLLLPLMKRKWPRSQAGSFFLLGVGGQVTAQLFITWGVRLSLASNAALLLLALPICTAVMAGLLLHFAATTWIGLAILATFQYCLSMVTFLNVLSRLDATQALSNYLIPFFGVGGWQGPASRQALAFLIGEAEGNAGKAGYF